MTKIEWTTRTWNPIRAENVATGGIGHYCQKVSEGCRWTETPQRRRSGGVAGSAASERVAEDDICQETIRMWT